MIRASQDADEVAQIVAIDGTNVVQAQLLEQRRPRPGDQTTRIPASRIISAEDMRQSRVSALRQPLRRSTPVFDR